MDIVDHAGHSYGPDSDGVNQALKEADNMISVLMNGLKLRGLHNCVNLVLLADHGMICLVSGVEPKTMFFFLFFLLVCSQVLSQTKPKTMDFFSFFVGR